MSLFESKDYEKLYDGFNSQERDFNPSLPPLPLCSGGRTTVKRFVLVNNEWKWLNLWKGYIQIGVGEFIYIRLGYESEKEPADTDAVVISDCWGSRSAIPTNKEPVKNWVMIYESQLITQVMRNIWCHVLNVNQSIRKQVLILSKMDVKLNKG